MLHYLCHTLSQCCFRQPLSDGLAPILSYKSESSLIQPDKSL